MNFLEIFISAMGGTGVCIAIAAYLGKKWVSHQLDKKLISYKKELEARTEVLKNNLSIYAHEQFVGISRIDAQRADAINKIYSSIVQWSLIANEINYPKNNYFDSVKEAFGFFGDVKFRINEANENIAKTMVENGIYLSSNTYESLVQSIHLLTRYTIDISKIIDHFILTDKIESLENTLLALSEEKAKFERTFDPIRGQLMDEFRCLLKAQ